MTHTTHTVDITPDGLKTPEGIARVNEALRVKENATADIVREASRLYREYLRYLPDEDTAKALEEETPYLGELLAALDKAQDGFLAAITNRTPTTPKGE